MAEPLNIPRKGTGDSYQQQQRSPTRLEQSTSFDGDHWDGVFHLASSLAQRVGGGPKGKSLPSDAELEAEAARAREHSRREAERILTQEAEERKVVEDRLRGLLDSTRQSPIAKRPLSTSPGAPSPLQMGTPHGTSPRDGGSWWSLAKAKLTPTKDKEPLTPAQQFAQDTRNKEKKDRMARDQNRLPDPSYLNLNSARPYTPSPNQSPYMMPTKGSNPIGGSPYKSPVNLSDDHSLYIQKTSDGGLDMSSTLIGLAKRFEKLEKWTVSHVRALEERMSDVERWLVEKEEEREREKETSGTSVGTSAKQSNSFHPREPGITLIAEQVSDMKHDLSELRTRVNVLGREVAKVAVGSPDATPVRAMPTPVVTPDPFKPTVNLNNIVRPLPSEPVHPYSEEKRKSPKKISGGSSVVLPHPAFEKPVPMSQPSETSNATSLHSLSATSEQELAKPDFAEPTPIPVSQEDKSKTPRPEPEDDPEVSPSLVSTYTARTRLPYPSGDYTSQPTSPSSPPVSPRNSIRSQNQISGLPRSQSPFEGRRSPIPSGLPMAPPAGPTLNNHHGSSSPTPAPRKRYTVALGRPIISPPASETGSATSFGLQLDRAFSKDAPDLGLGVLQDSSKGIENHESELQSSSKDVPPLHEIKRPRPKSSYGSVSIPDLGPTAPLRPRVRSKSTDRVGALGSDSEGLKDPYLERKRLRGSAAAPRTPVTTGRQKAGVDQLVKFFDGGN